MTIRITIQDQQNARAVGSPWVLEWSEKGVPMTVADLIRERVRIEFEAAHGVVDDRPRLIEAQLGAVLADVVYEAMSAFDARKFLLLVGDQQMEGLEEVIALRPETEVTFLRLVPLRGG